MFLLHNRSTILLRLAALTPRSRVVYKYQLCVSPPPLKKRRQLLQLSLTNRRSQLGHMVVVAQPNGPVRPLLSVGPDHPQRLGMIIVVRSYHATFSCGHVLSRVETEASHVRDRADPLSRKLRPMCLGSILYHSDTLLPGKI